MKRFVRNLTTSAEDKRENGIKRISHERLEFTHMIYRIFLPVFPTPLPPITAILMARFGAEYSDAGYSAMVVMFWMRRIVFVRPNNNNDNNNKEQTKIFLNSPEE